MECGFILIWNSLCFICHRIRFLLRILVINNLDLMDFLTCVSYCLPFPLSLPASTWVFFPLSLSVCLQSRSLTWMILGLQTPAAPTPICTLAFTGVRARVWLLTAALTIADVSGSVLLPRFHVASSSFFFFWLPSFLVFTVKCSRDMGQVEDCVCV